MNCSGGYCTRQSDRHARRRGFHGRFNSARLGGHPIRDVRIHLFRARKRTIAIADDVEVPEVKIGCEPRIGHTPIMKDH